MAKHAAKHTVKAEQKLPVQESAAEQKLVRDDAQASVGEAVSTDEAALREESEGKSSAVGSDKSQIADVAQSKKEGREKTVSNEATEAHKKRARKSAAIAALCLAAFAVAFIGLVTMLDRMAPGQQDNVEAVADSYLADPRYVLLIGSDSRKGTALYTGKANEASQVDQYADILTLMRVDPQTYTITLITIPRDTVVPGDTRKINSYLLSNNPEDVVGAVERLVGRDIDNYMMTTFTGFEDLINEMGGVTVDVPMTVTVTDPRSAKEVTVKEGKNQRLNGAEALVFARARKPYQDDQDAKRQVNVRSIEAAMIDGILHFDGDLNVAEILDILEDHTTTDMDLARASLMVADFVRHGDDVTIYSCTGPYVGDNRKSDGQWVVQGSAQTWAAIISAADAGDDPSDIVVAPSFS